MREKGRSIKSTPVKAAVIAKYANGECKTQIAEDLEISRPTVIRILNEAEIDEYLERGKSALYERIPDAVRTYGADIKRNADRAETFLERMKVLPSLEQSSNVNVGIGFNFNNGNSPAPFKVIEANEETEES